MIVEPEQRVADFAKAGADIISIHAEQSATIHLDRTINQVCSKDHCCWAIECCCVAHAGCLHACSGGCAQDRSLMLIPGAVSLRPSLHCIAEAVSDCLLRAVHPRPDLWVLTTGPPLPSAPPCCSQIKDLGCKAGVVLNPATPLNAIENVLSFVGALANALDTMCQLVGAASCVCLVAARVNARWASVKRQQIELFWCPYHNNNPHPNPCLKPHAHDVLAAADLVLIMSVNPGFGGQKFIGYQVDKIRKLRAMCNAVVSVLRCSPHALPVHLHAVLLVAG